MNIVMTLATHHQSFSALSQHSFFPWLLALEIFQLVDMMQFVVVTFCRSAKLTNLRFQTPL